MKKHYSELTCETDYFSARQEGAIMVFRPKGNQLLSSTLTKAKEAIIDYLKFAADHSEARIIIVMPQKHKIQREEYLSFYDMVRSGRISEASVMRHYRTIDQLILYILSSDLFFISVDYGHILPMFASIALACDFCIIGEDAKFQNPSVELGLVPKGGFAWFLNQTLGRVKTLELMLTNESIMAKEAKALGLVNRCIPVKNLEAEALSIARQFEALPESSLKTAKRLVNNTSKAFPDYLEYENHELIRSLAPQKIGMLKFNQ